MDGLSQVSGLKPGADSGCRVARRAPSAGSVAAGAKHSSLLDLRVFHAGQHVLRGAAMIEQDSVPVGVLVSGSVVGLRCSGEVRARKLMTSEGAPRT